MQHALGIEALVDAQGNARQDGAHEHLKPTDMIKGKHRLPQARAPAEERLAARADPTKFPQVSFTAFDFPVVPEVNMTRASALGSNRCASRSAKWMVSSTTS
mgnify:CR=1 FL=1